MQIAPKILHGFRHLFISLLSSNSSLSHKETIYPPSSIDLGKVEDEKHLLLVCSNTHKVREHFCSALPLTHISTLAELMQIMNMTALAKFVACCQYQRTICPP
jgi:hypothetical protein